jgi:hypothetical protein
MAWLHVRLTESVAGLSTDPTLLDRLRDWTKGKPDTRLGLFRRRRIAPSLIAKIVDL